MTLLRLGKCLRNSFTQYKIEDHRILKVVKLGVGVILIKRQEQCIISFYTNFKKYSFTRSQDIEGLSILKMYVT